RLQIAARSALQRLGDPGSRRAEKRRRWLRRHRGEPGSRRRRLHHAQHQLSEGRARDQTATSLKPAEGPMMGRRIAGAAVIALGVILTGTLGFSQTKPPIEGPAAGGSPAWFLQGSFPDP